MDADALKKELEEEQGKNRRLLEENNQLKEEVKRLKEQFIASEREEELITNRLMKRMEELKQEKEVLARQVEQEEEYLTNTLQQKLETLKQEKIDLENQLEQEEEYIVNKLQKQLLTLSKEKEELEKKLEAEQPLAAELDRIQKRCEETEKENQVLTAKLKALCTKNFDLKQKVEQEHQKLEEARQSKVKLEQDIEVGMDRIFNTQVAQLDKLQARRRTSSDLLTLKDPAISPAKKPLRLSSSPLHIRPGTSPPCSGPLSPTNVSIPMLQLGQGSTAAALVSPRHHLPSRRRRSLSNNPDRSSHKVMRRHSARLSPLRMSTPPIRQPFLTDKMPGLPNVRKDDEKYIKKGWLKRKDAYYPKSKRQFFFLFPNGELYCYDTYSTRLFLRLENLTRLRVARNPSKDGTYYMSLTTVHKHEYKLGVESKEELEEWCHLIQGLAPRLAKRAQSMEGLRRPPSVEVEPNEVGRSHGTRSVGISPRRARSRSRQGGRGVRGSEAPTLSLPTSSSSESADFSPPSSTASSSEVVLSSSCPAPCPQP